MTMAMKNPPRRTTIKGQKHLLAYITPEEAQLLMDNGGSGEPGPMGIPAFPPSERDSMGRDTGSGREGGSSGGNSGGGGGDPRGESSMSGGAGAFGEAGRGGRTGVGGGRERMEDFDAMVAGNIAAQAGALSASADQANRAQAARMAALFPEARQYVSNVASLQNLNRQLENLSRREQIQKDRINSLYSLIPGAGVMNYLGLQNVRNLASAAIGQPPGLVSGLGFGDRISPDFRGLGVSDLLGLQSQAVTDDMGNIIGFRDEYGTLKYGADPNSRDPNMGGEAAFMDAQYNPNTGRQDQCPEGYVFDEDLQACRMGGDLPMDYTDRPGVGAATGDLYGRMGLLDIAPTGLGMFKERFGAGFGTPSEFDAANLAFRRSGGVTRPYEGYTLLS